MVVEVFHSQVRSSNKMDVAILKALASFSHRYDVTDVILQDNEKIKAQYLRSLLFDLFQVWQAVRKLSKGISLEFKFSSHGIYNMNNRHLFKNKRLLFSHNKRKFHLFFLKNDITFSNNSTLLFQIIF